MSKSVSIAIALLVLLGAAVLLLRNEDVRSGTAVTSTTQAVVKAAGFISLVGDLTIGGDTSLATTTTESFTRGGSACTITDANGGTYTMTDAELANCSTFKLTASGAGQEVVALTFPATSTMALTIPNAGDCREWLYDASAVAAATTTTLTAGTGHDVIAATTNDDVIDGAEFAEILMCRQSDTDVTTYVNELLHAD